MSTSIQQIADDILLISFPWRVFGIDFKRNVTLLRISDHRIVVHSTAKFTTEDIAAMHRFGEPSWLLDATLFHDTFAKEGRAALPNIPYLAPKGFTKASGEATSPLIPPPTDWAGEIDVLKIAGTRTNEHLFFHRRSRTLVVADLFFSFPEQTNGWPRFCITNIMRLPGMFGISVFFRRLVINDRSAFRSSMKRLLDWDFERLIVAHSEPVETAAKSLVERAIANVLL